MTNVDGTESQPTRVMQSTLQHFDRGSGGVHMTLTKRILYISMTLNRECENNFVYKLCRLVV